MSPQKATRKKRTTNQNSFRSHRELLDKVSSKNASINKSIKFKETELGYHYELKIPGYVKEDFYFYLSPPHLIITTGRSEGKNRLNEDSDTKRKHSYCYPSAFFKVYVPLPNKPIKNEVTVNYKNEVLVFDLYKLKPSKTVNLNFKRRF